MEKVEFRIYHTFTYGEHKGKPNPATFVTLTLYRDADKGETVKDTIKRMESMLEHSQARWQILTAKETDSEREARYTREEKVVVKENEHPIIIATDGVIPTKKSPAKEARVAA